MSEWNTQQPVHTEQVAGSDRPAEYRFAETMDGLYAPYALRVPEGDGPHPFVFLAYGNGGGGMAWLQERVHRFRHVQDVLLDAGYASAWARYRTEVDLGYETGGRLRVLGRQGMELMNRSPLEYEDELSILQHVAQDPRIDGDRLFHVGVSHAGEMLFKLASQYDVPLRAAVAAEPASHELLMLRLGDEPTVQTDDGMRDLDSLLMREVDHARSAIADTAEVSARLDGVAIPVLVLGRDEDELQGVFRLTYDLLAEKRDDAEWRTWSHPIHGYIFPVVDEHGVPEVDEVQQEALDVILEFLRKNS